MTHKKINKWRKLPYQRWVFYQVGPMQFWKPFTCPRNMSISEYPAISKFFRMNLRPFCYIQMMWPDAWITAKGKKNLELRREYYRCFRTNEFHICIICFSSLVTSTKSSSIYKIAMNTCNLVYWISFGFLFFSLFFILFLFIYLFTDAAK